MAGQPLSSLRLKGHYDFGPLGLQSAPQALMAAVAQVIARWTLAQTHLGSAFAELIGSRSPSTVSIYASFDSFKAQKQMLVTASGELLPQRYARLCRALLAVIERGAKERHRFAHWVCGAFVGQKPKEDCLLLADPKGFWKLRVQQIKHFRRNPDDRTVHATQPRLDHREIMVYREADLLRVYRQLELAEWAAYGIECLVRATPKQRLQILRQLLAQPDVLAAYEKDRQTKKARPKAAPKQPRVSSRAKREAALATKQAKIG